MSIFIQSGAKERLRLIIFGQGAGGAGEGRQSTKLQLQD